MVQPEAGIVTGSYLALLLGLVLLGVPVQQQADAELHTGAQHRVALAAIQSPDDFCQGRVAGGTRENRG